MQPTQKLATESSIANTVKKAMMPMEACGIFRIMKTEPREAQMKPSLDANIFGALSTIFGCKPSNFRRLAARRHIGLYWCLPAALSAQSMVTK